METTERPLVHQPKTKTAFGSPKELAAAWKEFAAAKFKATDAEAEREKPEDLGNPERSEK